MSMHAPEVPVSAKVFLCILSIVQIAIGTVYLNECPLQPYIPIYLIVMGVFWVVLLLLSDLHWDQWVKNPPSACFV
ncbi:hypothetical protein INR49_025550 [Caranx melampygus]|nr:hypothetical protein INR49_025550 [Caranx melampygus]